jgi:hypothetical protein
LIQVHMDVSKFIYIYIYQHSHCLVKWIFSKVDHFVIPLATKLEGYTEIIPSVRMYVCLVIFVWTSPKVLDGFQPYLVDISTQCTY